MSVTRQSLFREPLLHFLGLGLGLFLLYALVAPADRGETRIVITASEVASLQTQFQNLWGRPPSAAELKALVDARVADEILYREGRAMGLDRDDAVIRRRVRQKYELIAEEEDGGDAPTEADLAAFLKAEPDRFRSPPLLTFRQVLVPTDGTGAEIEQRIEALRAKLTAGAAPESVGATSLLPTVMEATALDLVARDFGGSFAEALASAPIGKWVGPIASAYGAHLVKIEARTAAEVPPLDAIRSQVARAWETARRTKAREARMARLRERYDVVVEGLPTEPVE